jgi:hypothetical protein
MIVGRKFNFDVPNISLRNVTYLNIPFDCSASPKLRIFLPAGLPNRSAHGCRKIAATRAAENGATVAQLNAIFGWSGTTMASLYTMAADRKRLAREAMALVAGQNEAATSIPAPSQEVRAAERKAP